MEMDIIEWTDVSFQQYLYNFSSIWFLRDLNGSQKDCENQVSTMYLKYFSKYLYSINSN